MTAWPRPLAVVTALCGLLPVGALLAWSYGLASFRAAFLVVGVPPMLVLCAIGWLGCSTRDQSGSALALTAGVVGGLLGTIGYDLFRVPFALSGLRVFAPIESYGVLLLGADTSSPLTDLAGWALPLRQRHRLRDRVRDGRAGPQPLVGGRLGDGAGDRDDRDAVRRDVRPGRSSGSLIAIAYAAHVAYGLPLGSVVAVRAASRTRRRYTVGLAGSAGRGLCVARARRAGTGRPSARRPARGGPAPSSSAARLRPEWLRVAPGELRHRPQRRCRRRTSCRRGRLADAAHRATARLCFADARRAPAAADGPSRTPGGFVIVDATR